MGSSSHGLSYSQMCTSCSVATSWLTMPLFRSVFKLGPGHSVPELVPEAREQGLLHKTAANSHRPPRNRAQGPTSQPVLPPVRIVSSLGPVAKASRRTSGGGKSHSKMTESSSANRTRYSCMYLTHISRKFRVRSNCRPGSGDLCFSFPLGLPLPRQRSTSSLFAAQGSSKVP